jgi:hypothetical protein
LGYERLENLVGIHQVSYEKLSQFQKTRYDVADAKDRQVDTRKIMTSVGKATGRRNELWMNKYRIRYSFLVDKARRADLKRFYGALDALSAAIGGPRVLAECSGTLTWPPRGVFFSWKIPTWRVSRRAV